MNIHARKDGYDNYIDLERCFKVPEVKKNNQRKKKLREKNRIMIKIFNEIPRRKKTTTNKHNKNKKIKFQVFLLLLFFVDLYSLRF